MNVDFNHREKHFGLGQRPASETMAVTLALPEQSVIAPASEMGAVRRS